jgi:hypothetical protein
MNQINRTAGDADNEPLVLAGSDLTFTAVSKDGSLAIIKTDGDGISLDAEVGRLLVTLDEEDTAAILRPKNLLWDLTVTDVLGDTRELARGKIALRLPIANLI